MTSYCVRNCGTYSPYIKYDSFAFLVSALYPIHANFAPVFLNKMALGATESA